MRLLNEVRNYMGNYHVKSGVYHYYRSEYKQAIGFLRKALGDGAELSDGDLENARAYLALSHKGLALKLAARGEVEEGLEHMRSAAEINPSYPDLHFLSAGLLKQLQRSDEAVDAYRAAIAQHPGYLEARVALGYCLLESGAPDKAAEVFEEALSQKIARLREPCEKAIRQLREGTTDGTHELLHEVFLSAPSLAEEHLKKALEWMRAEDYEKALEDLDRALELNPRYPDVCNFRGIVLCILERLDEAADAFRHAAQLNPGHLVPRLNLAFTHVRAGMLREAEGELESILEEQPAEPVATAKLEELRAGRLGARPGV